MLTLPADGLIPIGSLPVAIEDFAAFGISARYVGFAEFRQEVARRRAIMKQRLEAMRGQLGLGRRRYAHRVPKLTWLTT